MLSPTDLFQLSQVAGLPPTSNTTLMDWTSDPGGTLIALLLQCPVQGTSLELVHMDHSDLGEVPVQSTRVPVGSPGGTWGPRCVCFSPETDFVLLCTRVGHLIVVPTELMVKGFKLTQGSNANYRDWSSTRPTRLPRSSSSPFSSSEEPSSVDSSSMSPTSLVWWNTQEFKSVAIMGTYSGVLRVVDVSNGTELGSIRVSSHPLTSLSLVTDNSLDATFLLITSSSHNYSQWRLLLEQRSTGYTFGSPSTYHATNADNLSVKSTDSDGGSTTTRSRLSGLRQMSLVGLSNLRQRISEGKRLLDRKVTAVTSPGVEEAEEALEATTVQPANTSGAAVGSKPVESLSSKIGDTRVSVQPPGTHPTHHQVISGVHPDTAILTLHNTELEVLPQAAYSLPWGSDTVLVLGPRMILVAAKVKDTTSVSLVSAKHAELQLERVAGGGSLQDVVFQSFTLSPGESVLAFLPCAVPCEPEDSPSSSHSEPQYEYEGDVHKTNEELLSLFKGKIKGKVAERMRRARSLFGRCLVVTTKGVYALQLDGDPIKSFLLISVFGNDALAAEQAQARSSNAEWIALVFNLDAKSLMELSADISLVEKDFIRAINLYRQAGCKHLTAVLKFACSGHIAELLSYLAVLVTSPRPPGEQSPVERIHLSNLALMAYFQQVLTKTTPVARSKFQTQIREFLDTNAWYDECLAVRMATETRDWDLLSHVSSTRGLHYEMVESIVAILLGKDNGGSAISDDKRKEVTQLFHEMPSIERNCLLACILHPNNVESVISNPELAQMFLGVLRSALPLLELQGLRSIVQQLRPDNPGLRSTYAILLLAKDDDDKETDAYEEFAYLLLQIFLAAMLLICKKTRAAAATQQHCDSYVPKRYLKKKEAKKCSSDSDQRLNPLCVVTNVISAGANHVLLRRKDSVVSWGFTQNGVLGHGAAGVSSSPPRRVNLFSAGKIKVLAVAAGKTHSLALTDSGLYAWGSSKYGQLGIGPHVTFEQRPRLITCLSNKVLLSAVAGQFHSVALDGEGKVWTWGWGVHGQLGHGDVEDEHLPRRLRSSALEGERVARISAGYGHTLLLTESGAVFAFGSNLFGQLGQGNTTKQTSPVKISLLPGPIMFINAGYFLNIAVDTEGRAWQWGNNPQILRLEAQQKKRERLACAKREVKEEFDKQIEKMATDRTSEKDDAASEDLQQMANSSAFQERIASVARVQVSQTEATSKANAPHLYPDEVSLRALDGAKVVAAACGNQHVLLASDTGAIFAYGRNMDCQLGDTSRVDAKKPRLIQHFKDDQNVCALACGADYSLAVTEDGCVHAWGNNAFGQLGKAPVENTNGEGSVQKVMVTKSTRRTIRLQNNSENQHGVPMVVTGVNENNGVYSEDRYRIPTLPADSKMRTNLRESVSEMARVFRGSQNPLKLLHLTLEVFHPRLRGQTFLKKCLVCENPGAAAKLSLLRQRPLQAFEFTLQLNIREVKKDESVCCRRIFEAFLFYLKETEMLGAARESEEENEELGRQLFERLVACWQDQKFSFLLMEKLFLKTSDPLVLQTVVLTLFRPKNDSSESSQPDNDRRSPDETNNPNNLDPADQGPVRDDALGPRLVDLFTPEFCLRVGDSFVKGMKDEREDAAASLEAVEWLKKQGKAQ